MSRLPEYLVILTIVGDYVPVSDYGLALRRQSGDLKSVVVRRCLSWSMAERAADLMNRMNNRVAK